MSNVIECGTCGYPLTPEERTGLVEHNGRMVLPFEQEPVAWCIVENGRVHGLVKTKPAVMNAKKWQPLYTTPQR